MYTKPRNKLKGKTIKISVNKLTVDQLTHAFFKILFYEANYTVLKGFRELLEQD